MKKNKLLAVLLALAMTLSLLPTAALAGEPAVYTGTGSATSVSLVKGETDYVFVSSTIYRNGKKLYGGKTDDEHDVITAVKYRTFGSDDSYVDVPNDWITNQSDNKFYFNTTNIAVGSYDIQITLDFTGTFNNDTPDISDDEAISVTGIIADTTLEVFPDITGCEEPLVLTVSDLTASYTEIGQMYLPIPFRVMCGENDVSGLVEIRWEKVEGVTMGDSDPEKGSDGTYTFGRLYPYQTQICGTVPIKAWAVYGHYDYEQSYELIVVKQSAPVTFNVTMTDCDQMFAAKIGSTGYGSLAAAITAAQPSETVTLLSDTTLTGETSIQLGAYKVEIPTGKTLTVAKDASLELRSSGTEAGTGLDIDGTIQVNGTLDISGLAYGDGGLIAGQSGSLSIGSTGKVELMSCWDDYSPNWLMKNSAAFFKGTVDGAKVILKSVEYTYNSTVGAWLKADAVAVATVVGFGGLEHLEGYSTLTAAVAAAKAGTTVTLLSDVTETISIAKDMTLNLGGHKLTGTVPQDKHEYIALTASAGNVVIQNGTIDGRVNAYDAATLTINEDVTITNKPYGDGNTCYGIMVWGDGTYGQNGCKTPTLNFYGSVSTTGSSFAICTNGDDTSNPIINIYDGASVTSEVIGIYLPSGRLNITGGNVTGKTAVYFKSTDMSINGGTFVGTGPKKDYNFIGGGADETGDAIVIDNCNYPNGVGTVLISDGTFTSNNADAVGSYAGNGQSDPLIGFITGGNFSSNPDAYKETGKIVRIDGAKAFVVVSNSGLTSGTYYTVPSVASGYRYTGSEGAYVVSKIPSTPSESGSTTTTPSQPTTSTETKPDGSTTTTESKPDGTVTESNTSKPVTGADGSTSQTTTETTTGKDGVTESKTETTTNKDGSGSATTETTVTKPDGTTTESKTETTINKDGSTASTTTATTTNKDGTVTESKTEATTSTVTNKDGSTTETKQETTTTSTGSKTESTTVTTVNKDGSSTATTTATTTDKAGTVTESKTESTTNKNGTTTEKTTTTETKANGTVTESKTETTINKDGSSKATTTETVTKADGTKVESKTTATTSLSTNKATGTVTETKKETTTTSDGVKSEGTTVTQIQKDGTVTSKETVKASDSTGTTATKTTTLDAKGNVTTAAEATVSTKAVTEAAKTGEAVTLPVEVAATKSASTAPTVSVSVPKSAESVKVELPVQNVTPGTVAVIVNADGTEKIVSTSMVTENGVALKLDGSTTVKLVDNAKSFKDVPETNVFYNEIASLSAREIMIGKTGDKFDLHNSVTLDQIANVAGRITGAVDVKDFNAGVAWGKDGGLKTGNVSATRGDVLKALYIAAGSPTVEDTGILAKFKDGANIPADMTAIAAWAAQNGILKGNVDGTAGLGNNVTRGQACALAGRTMGTLA